MRLHRRRGEEQRRGDLGVGQPAGHGAQHVPLPVGERAEHGAGVVRAARARRPRPAGGARVGANSSSPAATARTAATSSLGRRVLDQEAGRAGAQRLVDVPVEVERGQHEHPRPAGSPAAGAGSPRCRPCPACGRPCRRRRAARDGRPPAPRRRRRPRPRRSCRPAGRGSSGTRRGPAPGRRRGRPGSPAHPRALQRELGAHPPPRARRPRVEPPAEERHALPHARRVPARSTSRGPSARAGPPSTDLEDDGLRRRPAPRRAPTRRRSA